MCRIAAGEATAMAAVRRVLVDELGLDPSMFDLDGYWRQGTVEHDHHTPVG